MAKWTSTKHSDWLNSWLIHWSATIHLVSIYYATRSIYTFLVTIIRMAHNNSLPVFLQPGFEVKARDIFGIPSYYYISNEELRYYYDLLSEAGDDADAQLNRVLTCATNPRCSCYFCKEGEDQTDEEDSTTLFSDKGDDADDERSVLTPPDSILLSSATVVSSRQTRPYGQLGTLQTPRIHLSFTWEKTCLQHPSSLVVMTAWIWPWWNRRALSYPTSTTCGARHLRMVRLLTPLSGCPLRWRRRREGGLWPMHPHEWGSSHPSSQPTTCPREIQHPARVVGAAS